MGSVQSDGSKRSVWYPNDTLAFLIEKFLSS